MGNLLRVYVLGYQLTYGNEYDNPRDFRWWMFTFSEALRDLCTLAQQSVDNSVAVFYASTMIANQMIPQNPFYNEVNETLSRFQQKLPIAFARILDLIRTVIQGNALIGAFSSNWRFVVAEGNLGRNATFRTVPVTHPYQEHEQTCSCATLKTCTMPAQMFNNGTVYYTFEGLVFGCYFLETVLLSSLSCFYSEVCINNSRHALYTLYSGEGDYMLPPYMKLDASSSRFRMNDTIETFAYEMFIESWTSNVSYERFFNSCAPIYCVYIYYYRFDAFEVLTTFLSVFAGLSLGLRFVVPHAVDVFKRIANRFRIAPL